MAKQEIQQYIETRYPYWHDYAAYKAERAGIPQWADDLLQEVVISLMNKDDEKLQELYDQQKGKYRGIDFFVLRMISINATSNSAPFRQKVVACKLPVDGNEDIQRLDLLVLDEVHEDCDERKARIAQMDQAVSELCLSDQAREIYNFRMIEKRDWRHWEGPETKEQLNRIEDKLSGLIREKIFKNTLF